MNFLYINYPSWIKPEIIPGVQFLRWYGLMYIFAFATAFIILRKQKKEGVLDEPGFKATDDDLFSFITWGIVFLLLGARIFSTLVYSKYNPSDPSSVDYLHKPWLIFWPFNAQGKFTGLAGMSYHGGFIGGLIGMILWCFIKKRNLWKWIDAMCVAIPAGYTFGRIGNFLNGELYGRITTAPWGMIFQRKEMLSDGEIHTIPIAETFSSSLEWVQKFAAECGLKIEEGVRTVNLPRHPSQLYEAIFEGLVLFAILWFLRKKKPFDGFIGGCYTIGYGLVRFVIEYFRQPDSNMGYKLGNKSGELYMNTSFFNISTGQILCFLMITGGIGILIGCYIYSKKKLNKTTDTKK
ncbi:MAG: prolipoprotein diacylglyceryl transferase [Treponema sp.]|nr:prolipoprotein diacylglyceryl transferase [Treponema sp.]